MITTAHQTLFGLSNR